MSWRIAARVRFGPAVMIGSLALPGGVGRGVSWVLKAGSHLGTQGSGFRAWGVVGVELSGSVT